MMWRDLRQPDKTTFEDMPTTLALSAAFSRTARLFVAVEPPPVDRETRVSVTLAPDSRLRAAVSSRHSTVVYSTEIRELVSIILTCRI